MKKIRVAVSGAGNRACSVVRDLHEAAKGGVEIVAIYDPDAATAKKAAATFFRSPDAKICKSWKAALAIDCAARENRIVDLLGVWKKLGC